MLCVAFRAAATGGHSLARIPSQDHLKSFRNSPGANSATPLLYAQGVSKRVSCMGAGAEHSRLRFNLLYSNPHTVIIMAHTPITNAPKSKKMKTPAEPWLGS